MRYRLFSLTLLLTAVTFFSCTDANTDTSPEQEREMNVMDSTSKAIEDSTRQLEDQTEKVEDLLERLDKEFDSTNRN